MEIKVFSMQKIKSLILQHRKTFLATKKVNPFYVLWNNWKFKFCGCKSVFVFSVDDKF